MHKVSTEKSKISTFAMKETNKEFKLTKTLSVSKQNSISPDKPEQDRNATVQPWNDG